MPGIKEISAAMLLAEIGADMDQFGSGSRLCSCGGVCPGNNESAGKKSGRTRHANPYLRSLLCEIAHCAVKTKSQFKGIYNGLKIRRGKKRAIVAVGHKILKVSFVILKNLEPYRNPDIDYGQLVVDRNAPRWLQALRNYGYIE